jgi:hypothetical protein
MAILSNLLADLVFLEPSNASIHNHKPLIERYIRLVPLHPPSTLAPTHCVIKRI